MSPFLDVTAAGDVSGHPLSIALQARIESAAKARAMSCPRTGDTAMITRSWRPLLAVCASFVPFVSFAQAPTTFSDTFGVTQGAATAAPAPIFRHPPPGTDLRSWVIHWNEVAINAS